MLPDMLLRCSAFALALTGILSARSFTDSSGKTIEAEFVSLAGETVTISRDGKPFTLPLSRFSKADQDFIKEQATAKPVAPAATGKLMLAGKKLNKGGEMNVVEAPLSEETLKKTRKNKEIKSIKLGVVLPANFDPATPGKVLWISAAINSDAERTAGNLSAMNGYSGTAVANGWVVVAVDTNLGNPRQQDHLPADFDMAVQQQGVAMLSAAWPGFAKSQFACAGFSGGSKSSFYRLGHLSAAGLNVTGLFLGGCNQNLTSAAKEETKVRGGDLKKVKVFVSSGKTDDISTVQHCESVAAGVEKDFGKVRLEVFEGGHSLSQEHLKAALAWFAEAGDVKGK
jgi:dienelactone hydrolase